jgi:hypothetical protein
VGTTGKNPNSLSLLFLLSLLISVLGIRNEFELEFLKNKFLLLKTVLSIDFIFGIYIFL